MLKRFTPVLRMFDVAKALEFYVGFLGFEEKWRHQLDGDAPIYLGLERDGLHLHLTEHFGDASPGSHVRIEVEDVQRLCSDLDAKAYRHARPQLEERPWGNREITIPDPFGNRLTFWTAIPTD
jgi:catechol 2,3-dioxygenase-like lactoylglutathione lyase family enzyme